MFARHAGVIRLDPRGIARSLRAGEQSRLGHRLRIASLRRIVAIESAAARGGATKILTSMSRNGAGWRS